jgi:hypothetical protein
MTGVDWREPEGWSQDGAGGRFRFTYGTESRSFDDGCYTFEVRMQRYEYVNPDGTPEIDGRSVYVAEAEISPSEARELAALLLRLAEGVER